MSLDFNVSDIQNYDENFPSQITLRSHTWNSATLYIAWGALAIGMQQITEKNYSEFFRRLAVWYDSVWDEDLPVTLKDVRLHIGLKTNVGNMSSAQFKQHVERNGGVTNGNLR